MKRAFQLTQRRVRGSLLIAMLVATSLILLWPASRSRLDSPHPVTSAGTIKITSALHSPMTFAELVTLAPSRLEGCDIATMNLLCAEGLPNAEGLNLKTSLALLDGWVVRVKSETQRHFYRFQKNPAEFEHSEGYFRMLMMAVVLSEDLQIRYNPERIASPGPAALEDGFFSDSRDVLLHGLLGPRRMGTCSSMPVLYAALGRRLGYPLKLVTTKGHLFVRWDGPTERFNLDATGQGLNRYDDEYYRSWPFPVTEAEIQEHGYLKSLTVAEELAVFLSIRGHCLEQAGRYAEAVSSYEHAVRLRPASQDQQWLLAQARLRSERPSEPRNPVSTATAIGPGRMAGAFEVGRDLGSEFVPNPDPLRPIR